jgi:hypothetical protein
MQALDSPLKIAGHGTVDAVSQRVQRISLDPHNVGASSFHWH